MEVLLDLIRCTAYSRLFSRPISSVLFHEISLFQERLALTTWKCTIAANCAFRLNLKRSLQSHHLVAMNFMRMKPMLVITQSLKQRLLSWVRFLKLLTEPDSVEADDIRLADFDGSEIWAVAGLLTRLGVENLRVNLWNNFITLRPSEGVKNYGLPVIGFCPIYWNLSLTIF